jgi:hypothetical protein
MVTKLTLMVEKKIIKRAKFYAKIRAEVYLK